jgi:hypothetical protein
MPPPPEEFADRSWSPGFHRCARTQESRPRALARLEPIRSSLTLLARRSSPLHRPGMRPPAILLRHRIGGRKLSPAPTALDREGVRPCHESECARFPKISATISTWPRSMSERQARQSDRGFATIGGFRAADEAIVRRCGRRLRHSQRVRCRKSLPQPFFQRPFKALTSILLPSGATRRRSRFCGAHHISSPLRSIRMLATGTRHTSRHQLSRAIP